MIIVDEIKIPVDRDEMSVIKNETAKKLGVDEKRIKSLRIERRSIDARKKPKVMLNYAIVVEVSDEKKVLQRARGGHCRKYQPVRYRIPKVTGEDPGGVEKRNVSFAGGTSASPVITEKGNRPIIIGAGPAGLFCAYVMVKAGLSPIVIERGKRVDDRRMDVETYFSTGILAPESNVVFGEGGAGTFSDGKLNTSVKDKEGRNRFVRETFHRFGADESILYDAKPHIGTDRLFTVIPSMREAILTAGGEFLFSTKMEELIFDGEQVTGVRLSDGQTLSSSMVVLAIGHSARDTFRMLYDSGIPMEAKSFAVGYRVEHPQAWIDEAQYGKAAAEWLAAAPYKLVAKDLPRAVYSFCMCPGGYVIDSSSEEGHTCINGMSYKDRDGDNANSAIVVAVGENEYDINDPMAAITYQRSLERKIFERAGGAVLQQLYGDYLVSSASTTGGNFATAVRGRTTWGNLRGIISPEMEQSFTLGMEYFAKRIPRFADGDVILSGIESRTSSPVRILRDSNCMSRIRGLFPCGEGAGYAGGIASAAMDGMRVAEAVIRYMNETEV